MFGEGIATEYNDKQIVIEFDDRKRIFQMPQAFDKHLKSEYTGFAESIVKKTHIDSMLKEERQRKEQIERELKELII